MPLPVPGLYDGTIPQPTDQLNDSQPEILNNFGANQNFLEFDSTGVYLTVGGHGAFASAVPGQHVYLEIPNMAIQGFTIPAIQNDEMAMYSNTSLTGNTDIFIQKQNLSPAPLPTHLIPMTASNYAIPGYTYLPSGLILKWGTITQLTNTIQNNIFPAGPTVPPYTVCLSVLLTVAGGSAADQNTAVQLGTILAAAFEVRTTSRNGGAAAANTTYNYFAIGY